MTNLHLQQNYFFLQFVPGEKEDKTIKLDQGT